MPRRPASPRPLWWLVSVTTLGVLAMTLLRASGVSDGPWPIPSVIAFTTYALPVAIAGAVLAAALRRKAATAVLAGCALALALALAPRELPEDQPDARGPTVRVLAANLLHGEADPFALAALIRERRPDVVSLEEVSPQTAARLRAAGVFAPVPQVIRRDGSTWHDTLLATRWPMEKREVGLPSVYLTGLVQVPGREDGVAFVSAHPTPPVAPAGQRRWTRWLRSLPAPRASPLAGGIVMGDFNATLDHAELRAILDLGWRDAARERGEALTPTWQGLRGTLRLTLDHILVPPGAAVTDYAVDDLPGSDHDAISATITLPAR